MLVTPVDLADLDGLRPAWLALAEHQAAVTPGMGPARDPGSSWARRREQYAGWLADERSVALAAREDGALLGYVLLRAEHPWSVRVTGDPVMDLETFSVLPEARGRGVGAALWAAAEAHVRAVGAREVTLGVATANAGARRFYDRLGFRPLTSVWVARPVPEWPVREDVAVTAVGASEVEELRPLHHALSARHALVGPAHLPPQRDYDEHWQAIRDELVGEDEVLLRAGDDGFTHATISRRGFAIWDTGPAGTVQALVVREGARGRGIGAALLAAVARELRAAGVQILQLQVLEGNTDAHRFYAREGLTRTFEGLLWQAP